MKSPIVGSTSSVKRAQGVSTGWYAPRCNRLEGPACQCHFPPYQYITRAKGAPVQSCNYKMRLTIPTKAMSKAGGCASCVLSHACLDTLRSQGGVSDNLVRVPEISRVQTQFHNSPKIRVAEKSLLYPPTTSKAVVVTRRTKSAIRTTTV